MPSIMKTTAFLSIIFILLFFLLIFSSPAIFTDPQQVLGSFSSIEVRFAIKLSLLTALIATIISISIATPAAYAISRYSFKGKTFVEGFLDIPMALPPVALGVMMLIFFARNPLGSFINNNIMPVIFNTPGIVIAQFAVVSALAVRLLKETFDGVPPRYEKIARTLGYTELEAFLHVTFPMAIKGFLATCLFVFARAMGEFGATLMLAGATRLKTETLPIAIYLSLAKGDLEGVAALSYVLLLISIITQIIIRKLLFKGAST